MSWTEKHSFLSNYLKGKCMVPIPFLHLETSSAPVSPWHLFCCWRFSASPCLCGAFGARRGGLVLLVSLELLQESTCSLKLISSSELALRMFILCRKHDRSRGRKGQEWGGWKKGIGKRPRLYQNTDYKAVYTLLQCYYLNVPGIILGQKSSIPELVEPHR